MGTEGRLTLAGSWVWRHGESDVEGSPLKMSTDVVARVARHAAAMENINSGVLHCRAKESLKKACARVCVCNDLRVCACVCVMTYVCMCMCV